MSNDCPYCEAGHKAVTTITIDFSKVRAHQIPKLVEAARKADKVIFLNLEMGPRDFQKLIDTIKS